MKPVNIDVMATGVFYLQRLFISSAKILQKTKKGERREPETDLVKSSRNRKFIVRSLAYLLNELRLADNYLPVSHPRDFECRALVLSAYNQQ